MGSKRIFLALALSALLPRIALAQQDEQHPPLKFRYEVGQSRQRRAEGEGDKWHRFGGGISLGVAASQVDGDGNAGYHKPSPTFGIWVDRQMTARLFLRMDLRYMGKGAWHNSKINGGSRRDYTISLHYLELPLTAEYFVLPRLSIAAGLGFGYLMGASESNRYGELPLNGARQFRRFELSAQASLAFRISSHFTARGGGAYSILPIRGLLADPLGYIRHGQYNNLLYVGIEYEI